MSYLKYTISLLLISIVFIGCVPPTQITKQERYPKFYKQHPKSILVLPALNSTTAVGASEQYRYTITKALTERGYYVFPVHLVDKFLKSENLPDAQLAREIPIKKLKEIFGADAVLYVDIFGWDTDYSILTSSVDVALNFSLINTNTEEEIWQSNAFGKSALGANSGGIIELVVSMIAVAVNTSTDYTEVALFANEAAFDNLPSGEYQKDFKIDQNTFLSIKEADPMDRSFFNFDIEKDRLYVGSPFLNSFVKKEKGKLVMSNAPSFQGGGSVINNFAYVSHSGYDDYYYVHNEKGKTSKRHRFFIYENGKPYLISENKKVFVTMEKDGTIPYQCDYFFIEGEDDDNDILSLHIKNKNKEIKEEVKICRGPSLTIDKIVSLKEK